MASHDNCRSRPKMLSREIGSLRTLSNGESQYVGSSSGVYFINTVRRAFALSASSRLRGHRHNDGPVEIDDEVRENPSPEDCLVGEAQYSEGVYTSLANPGRSVRGRDHGPEPPSANGVWLEGLRQLPGREVARRLVLSYFRIWHPVAPFLHGPDIISGLDALYADNQGAPNFESSALSRLVIYKCIFSIAALDYAGESDVEVPVISSAAELLSALGPITLRCDIHSTQALLAAELYFIATMALRKASTVGGMVMRAVVQSGLHRCPFRYCHLSPEERNMRKRIFWSAYSLDRFLSQSLGHPLGIQDSDIDVCVPGSRDLHEPVAQSTLSPASASADTTILHLAIDHPERRAASPRLRGRNRHISQDFEDGESRGAEAGVKEIDRTGSSENCQPTGQRSASVARAETISQHRRDSQAILDHHVRYSQLIGRMLEIYHKSIHARHIEDHTIVLLKADVSAWGNVVPQPHLSHVSTPPRDPDRGPDLGPDPTIFPLLSYKYARLLINRPMLSLDPMSPDFRNSIQVCVGAATTIIQTLDLYVKNGGTLFWPGYMSSVWMSGLVLAYAAHLRQHGTSRAVTSIVSALGLLKSMTRRWNMAGHCKEVLSMLLESLTSPSKDPKRRRSEAGTRNTNGHIESGRSPKRRLPDVSPRDVTFPTPNREPYSTEGPYSPGGRTTRANRAPRGSLSIPRPAPSFKDQEEVRIQASGSPGALLFDQSSPWDGQSQHLRYPPGQPDFDFNFLSQDEAGAPWTTQQTHIFHTPIPTTFPNRFRQEHEQGANHIDYIESTFDLFDGATWGPLIDMVDESTRYMQN